MPKPRRKKCRLALDTETTGLDLRHGAKPFLVTFADQQGNNTWFEWEVDPLTRQPCVVEEDLRAIQELIDSADELVLQNAKFDVAALQTVFSGQLRWDWSKVQETLFSGHLLASNHPHDLASMAVEYLGVDVFPLDERVKQACNEARRIARRDYPEWRIARKDLPEMPSAKGSFAKYDMWLMRAIAWERKYPANHDWWSICADYANGDSIVTLALFGEHERLMHERGLECIYCARLKLLPIVYEMESYGVTLSRSRLEQLSRDYRQQSQRYGRVCTNIARGYGYELTLPKSGNNKSLLEFCFGRVKDVEVSPGVVTTSYDRNNCLALVPAKVSKKTGAPSLDKQVLEHYESTLPLRSKQLAFLRALRNKRKRDTAINYLDGYQRYWRRWGKDTYVLHPSLNPTGTDTLRWSSSNPNEQNISKLEGFNLRYAFGPAPGRLWASLDYNNIELRIPAYESGEEVMIEIFERPDDPPYFGSYHLVNASIIYPEKFWPLAERKDAFKNKYKSTYYQWVKNFGFALAYGAVPESGTADRAAHKPGAQLMVMDRLKEHTKLNRSVVRFAERYGYVETLPDREVDPKRGYPLLCTRTENGGILPTVPLNYRIQGTACWVAARAMVKLKDYFRSKPALEDWHLILNVHDEVVLDFPADCDYKPVLRKVASIMESMGDCIGIPLTVGCELHNDNWSEGIDCG